jgi:polyhydroxybutyrate depolymerase
VRTLLFLALAAVRALPAAAQPLAPGDYRFELTAGGRERSYLLHVPPQSAAGPRPLLVSLHGGGGNARQHRDDTGLDAAADREGYVAAYPNGTGRLDSRMLTWNAGGCCGYAQKNAVDDVGFIAAMLDDIEHRVAVDARRIYVVGHSNGGMMAHRVGEALPQRIAAIVSVAGSHVPAMAEGRALPVLQIHSVDDPRALYKGGLGPPFPFTNARVLHPAVEDTLAAWARRDGCAAQVQQREQRQAGSDTAKLLVYPGCRDGAEVALWQLTGAGHGWPGGKGGRESIVGPATKVIDANTEIWRFVSRFSLPN